MKNLYIPNFDFEYQLGERLRRQIPAAAARLSRELAAVWVGIALPGDFIWIEGGVEPGFFDGLTDVGLPPVTVVNHPSAISEPGELCPWGWTEELRMRAAAHGWLIHAPEQSAVDRANARSFSFALERRWDVGLDGACEMRSTSDLVQAVDCLPDGIDNWVVKAEYGMSGRERMLGKKGRPIEAAQNWLRKKLAEDAVAFFEPWVERIEEVGLQFTVPVAGDPVFDGLATLLADPTGRYRGNRFTSDAAADARWLPAIATGHRVARALQEIGYYGPLGIDAARYRTADGLERLRPIQDINARYTMGRIALGFKRLLKSGEQGSWIHVIWPDTDPGASARWWDAARTALPEGVRAIRTTPFTVAGQPTRHGTAVLIADTLSQLERAEHALRARR